jgi:hypothetical protein
MSFNMRPNLALEMMADKLYDRLENHIKDAESKLAEDEQLAVLFHSNAGEGIIVNDIGYHNPMLIKLYGTDQHGNDCTILAHMHSVQLILRVQKLQGTEQRKNIGFRSNVAP